MTEVAWSSKENKKQVDLKRMRREGEDGGEKGWEERERERCATMRKGRGKPYFYPKANQRGRWRVRFD